MLCLLLHIPVYVFFKLLMDAIAKVVSCLGPLVACEYNINLESTSIAMCDLV